jgi:hypothetical protein
MEEQIVLLYTLLVPCGKVVFVKRVKYSTLQNRNQQYVLLLLICVFNVRVMNIKGNEYLQVLGTDYLFAWLGKFVDVLILNTNPNPPIEIHV